MQSSSNQEERFRLFPVLIVIAIGLIAVGQMHLLREMRKLREHLDLSVRSIDSDKSTPDHERANGPIPRTPFVRAGDDHHSTARVRQISSQTISLLEQRVNELARALEHPPGARAVAEYNVMSPPIGPDQTEPPLEKRGWGQEQIVGPPDTPTASDARTAWAPREQNAGHEWLAVDFAHPVDVAEVRIRETYNPGAISKVTGVVNGQELVLWEGTASGGAAPRDFVVPVPGPLQANSVVVHLDTSRVPGWNEIDAVELIGKDGTRQWAQSVTASSSYADGRKSGNRRQLLNEETPFLSR